VHVVHLKSCYIDGLLII